MHLLNTLLALTSLIGFTVSAPSPQLGGIIDPLLGGLLGSIGNLISSGFGDELGSIIPTQLASGILGDAASLIGFEPLITFCQENSANETLYAAVTYTDNPSVVVPFVYGECAPYDIEDANMQKASMDLVYFCKPGYCHTFGDYVCTPGNYGNIGDTPLPLPAGFFLPNLLDAIDILGLAANCTANPLGV